MKLKGPGPPGTMLLLGSHLNWLPNMKLKGPGPLRTILLLGAHLNIIVGGPFKLVGKHEIEGARALWINIIIDYCCTNVLLYAKIVKETEETIVFFVTF